MFNRTWQYLQGPVRAHGAFACTIALLTTTLAACVDAGTLGEILDQFHDHDGTNGHPPPEPQSCAADGGATAPVRSGPMHPKQWQLPELIEALPGNASSPQIAVNAAGDALLDWVQSDGTSSQIVADAYVASSGWQGTTVVSPGSSSVSLPAVALDSAGRGLLVWHDQPNPALMAGTSATWSQASGYGAPTRFFEFDPLPWATFGPSFAAHADGRAFAVWGFAAGRGSASRAHRYDPATGWGAGVNLQLDPMQIAVIFAPDPGLALGPEGRAFMSYAHDRPGVSAGGAWTNISTPDAPSGTAYPLDNDPAFAGQAAIPQVAADACGNAVVVWLLQQPTQDVIASARYIAGTGWTAPQSLQTTPSDGNPLPEQPQTRPIFTSDGRGCAVWLRSDASRTDVWASCLQGDAWEAPANIDQLPDGVSANVQIAADGVGGLVAVWSRSASGERHIYANQRSASSGWDASQRLDTRGADAHSPAIGLDAAGNGFTVWAESDDSETNVVVSRYE